MKARIYFTILTFGLIVLSGCASRKTDLSNNEWAKIARNQYNYIEEAFYIQAKGLYVETLDSLKQEKKIYSYLWPLCALIQAAAETDESGITGHFLDSIHHRLLPYGSYRPPVFAYSSYPENMRHDDRFYDDNQWIAIALLDAYNRSSKPKEAWLQDAKRIYDFQMSGYDSVLGGGIYWNEGEKKSKNTCSNGPGALVALKLYQATKNPEYLSIGREIYEWTQENLQDTDGIYLDAVIINPMRIDRRKFSYNTGTMMESAAMLYEITGEEHFRAETERLAEAAYQHFLISQQGRGNVWFNAVLMRAYVYADKFLKNQSYKEAWNDYARKLSEAPPKVQGTTPYPHLLEEAAKLEIWSVLSRWSSL